MLGAFRTVSTLNAAGSRRVARESVEYPTLPFRWARLVGVRVMGKLETLGQVCTGMCSCGVWTPSAGDFHLAIDVKRVW